MFIKTKRMKNNITHLPNGDFKVEHDETVTLKVNRYTLGEAIKRNLDIRDESSWYFIADKVINELR